MRCGTFPANTRHSCDMCSVGPTSSTLVRRGTGVVRFLLFLVGWPGVVLMFALFETSAPYFIYACVPTSGHTVLARSRFSVGPLSKTLARYWTATGSVYWVVMCCCWAYTWAVYLEFFSKNVIIFSSQRARHVYPELDPHLGRASGGYVVCWVNKSSYLAHRTCLLCFGSVLVHCLWHWPSVEPIWIESVVFLHLFGHCPRNSIYRACPASSIRWLVLDQCWSRVSDSGSVLDRYWYGVSCLLGLLFYITIITTCVIIIISIYIFCLIDYTTINYLQSLLYFMLAIGKSKNRLL